MNRPLGLHRPEGTHSSYFALRGQTLILECIPYGLYVLNYTLVFSSRKKTDSFWFFCCYLFPLQFPHENVDNTREGSRKRNWPTLSAPSLCARPTPSVEWDRKGPPLSSSHATKERFDRWLEFTSISENDHGEYTCTASNTLGKVTHLYTVTVEGNYAHLQYIHTVLAFPPITLQTFGNLNQDVKKTPACKQK